MMAKKEHDSWMQEKLDDGYGYGEQKDSVLKTHPCLLPWEDLPEKEKDKDREAVKNIPEVLASIGFEVYRMA